MLKMTRGNIDTSKPLFSSSRKRHFTAASVPPSPPISAVIAALQQHRSTLQRELNVFADAVVQIDRRRIDRPSR